MSDDKDSVRSALRAAFDNPTPDVAATDAPATESATPYTPEGGAVADSGDAAPAAKALPTDAPAERGGPVAAAAVAAPGAPAAVTPPAGFKDVKAWETTPDATKQFIKDREANYARGYQKAKQAADFGTAAFRAIEPLLPTLRAQGVHPAQAIAGMANLITTLRTGTERERYEAFAGAAQEYGVDLQRLVQQGVPTDSTPAHPEVAALKRQIAELAQHVTGNKQHEEAAQQQWAYQNVSGFASKPEVAELLPFVQEDMARILESSLIDETGKSPEQVMQEAYEMACYRNPSIRERQQQKTLQRQAEEAKKLRNAASVSSNSSHVAGGTVPSDESLRGSLERQFAGWRA